MKETDVDELCKEIYDRTTNDIDFATQNFVTRLRNIFLQEMAITTGTVCATSFMNMRLNWQRKII